MNKPKIHIPFESYRKIMQYALAVDGEVTGFADVWYNHEEKRLQVENVYLLKQEAHSAEVEMNEEDVAAFNLACIQEGMNQLPQLWWHSHNNMETFLSSTDHTTLDELKNGSFIVALVVNKRQEIYGYLRIYSPVEFETECDVTIDFGIEDIPQAIKDEVEEKVEVKRFILPANVSGGGGGGYYKNWRKKKEKSGEKSGKSTFQTDVKIASFESLKNHWLSCLLQLPNCKDCQDYRMLLDEAYG